MDLKIVIRQLLDKGLSREQVIYSLKELGVDDAERIFDEAIAPSVRAKTVLQPQPQPQPPKATGETEISISELVESQGKSKSLFASEEKEGEKEEGEKPLEEMEETKEKGERKARTEGGKQSEIPRAATPQSLEEKIDETLALLKALKAINEKILETDRKLLLKTKS